jgi:hypothetical protein
MKPEGRRTISCGPCYWFFSNPVLLRLVQQLADLLGAEAHRAGAGGPPSAERALYTQDVEGLDRRDAELEAILTTSLVPTAVPGNISRTSMPPSSNLPRPPRRLLATTSRRCISPTLAARAGPYFNGAALLILTYQFLFMHNAAAFLTFPCRPTDASGPRNRPATVGGRPTEDGWEGHRDRTVPLQFHP